MERLGLRVIVFEGNDRLAPAREKEFARGVLLCLDEVIEYIMQFVPRSEVIRAATRVDIPLWPKEAIREAIVNAVGHRDYQVNRPVDVEIFSSRIEVTSPGGFLPGQAPLRLLDKAPQTRNELLVDALRKARLCEDRGRGIDLIVHEAELHGMPAPGFMDDRSSFRVTLNGPRPLSRMAPEHRIEAIYYHVALSFISGRRTTNTTLRERFGLRPTNSNRVTISRLLSDTIERSLIKIENPDAGVRSRRYVPYWA